MAAGPTSKAEPVRPRLWLARHGETEWSATGRHTGRADITLDDRGREQAIALGAGLARLAVNFDAVWASPLTRARETANLAGFGKARVMENLAEWDYGEFEGRSTSDIRRELGDPNWLIWTTTIRKGETVEDVGRRADAVLEKLLDSPGAHNILLFSHGHFLRMLTARWIGLPAAAGQHWALATGTLSILGYENEYRVVERWNAPVSVVKATHGK